MGNETSITRLLTTFIIFLSPHDSTAQEIPDSLIMELERTYNKESRLELLWEIVVKSYETADYDTTIYFARQHLNLAKSLGKKDKSTKAIWAIGLSYKQKGDFNNAAPNMFKALKLFEEANQKTDIYYALYNIGQIFKKGNDFEKGISYLKRALDMSRSLKDNQLQAKAHYEIARGYLELGIHKKSLFHLDQCLKKNDLTVNQGLTSKAYNYLGINYYQMALYDSAIVKYSKAKEYAVGLSDYDTKSAIAFNNIGEVYAELKEYAMAKSHYQEALTLKRKLKDPDLLAGTLINLGKLALLENQPSEAIPYLEEIILILDKGSLSKNLKEASVLLAEAYKSKQNLTAHDMEKIIALNEQYARDIHALKQTEFQQSMISTVSKSMLENEALYLKKKVEKTHHISLWIIGVSFMVIIGFLLLLYYRERKFKLFVQRMWEDVKDI